MRGGVLEPGRCAGRAARLGLDGATEVPGPPDGVVQLFVLVLVLVRVIVIETVHVLVIVIGPCRTESITITRTAALSTSTNNCTSTSSKGSLASPGVELLDEDLAQALGGYDDIERTDGAGALDGVNGIELARDLAVFL